MAELNKVKSFSAEEMQEYCKEHIDRYKVEPIIREAFHQGLISPDVAYVHLRIAQLREGKEKISYGQIAQETYRSPSSITQYKQNPLKGVSQMVFVKLLLKTHPKDWLNLCECNNPNEALAEYVNKYRGMAITNGIGEGLQREGYELERKEKITKDVCRKIYDSLIQTRKCDWRSAIPGGIVIRAEVVEQTRVTVKVLFKWGDFQNGNDRSGYSMCSEDKVLEFNKKTMVHKVAYYIQNTIGGFSSKYSCWQVYLYNVGSRKIGRAMEYIALNNEKVFLL